MVFHRNPHERKFKKKTTSHHIFSVALEIAAIALSESRSYEPSEATGYCIEKRTRTELSIFYT